ncbi:hypothetical protein DVH24_020614 [Malus domestica]|uniref:Uncharacterized protein n=1 Tax=Malus domestica TaxID=3750 RepID=A0A498JDZ8_MALDO|nr:hypothetical protein DVH24_020614 [Malus domestica]
MKIKAKPGRTENEFSNNKIGSGLRIHSSECERKHCDTTPLCCEPLLRFCIWYKKKMLRKCGGKSETGKRASSAQICSRIESSIISPHRGSVNSLQLDLTEGRYLLSSASDASAAVFDVQRRTDYVGGGTIKIHKCLFAVDKQHEHGHKYAMSSAVWYPVDTGLFVTGSYDHHINVKDTNTT